MERVVIIKEENHLQVYGDVILILMERKTESEEFHTEGWKFAEPLGRLAPKSPEAFRIAFKNTEIKRPCRIRPTLKIFTERMRSGDGSENGILFRACDPSCRDRYLVGRLAPADEAAASAQDQASIAKFFCAVCGRPEADCGEFINHDSEGETQKGRDLLQSPPERLT